MFGKPNYTLKQEELIAAQEEDRKDLFMVASLQGNGPYNGVVVGLSPLSLSNNTQVKVEFDILALPHNMMRYAKDISQGRGKVFKDLNREINKTVSYTIAQVVNELKQDVKEGKI